MRFFKDNSESIIKLFINQIGIAIFSMFLYTAAGAIKSETGGVSLLINVLISVFSTLFYFLLIYNVAWEIGAKDKIRIDGGRMESTPKKGILMGLFANVPNIIFLLIALLFLVVRMAFAAEWAWSVFGVLNAIFRIFISVYLGIIMGISASLEANTVMYYFVQTIGFIVFSFVSAGVIHLSYILGLKDFRLFGKSNSSNKNQSK